MVVENSRVIFRWPAVSGARRYYLQISKYPDFRLPYSVNYDVNIPADPVDLPPGACPPGQACFGSPFLGEFSPDTDYFWRVRALTCPTSVTSVTGCLGQGLWGPWSDTWRFGWSGPRVPVDVRHEMAEDGTINLTWRANPGGSIPRYYDVYGSDERGFTVSKAPFSDHYLGPQGSNFLGRVEATNPLDGRESLAVAPMQPDPCDQPSECLSGDCQSGRCVPHPNHFRTFYRVVAVDENGVESGPSAYAELPHPYLVSQPPLVATVGINYQHQLQTLRSIGDAQYRHSQIILDGNGTPRVAGIASAAKIGYWERESYRYSLVRGPAWLSVDPITGQLSGVPLTPESTTVEVRVDREYPQEIATSLCSSTDSNYCVAIPAAERFSKPAAFATLVFDLSVYPAEA
jgi:hypothetical protein